MDYQTAEECIDTLLSTSVDRTHPSSKNTAFSVAQQLILQRDGPLTLSQSWKVPRKLTSSADEL